MRKASGGTAAEHPAGGRDRVPVIGRACGSRWRFQPRVVLLCLAGALACNSVDEADLNAAFRNPRNAGDGIAVGVPDGGKSGDMRMKCDEDSDNARCALPNAIGICASGECVLERCTGGYVDCDGDTGGMDAGPSIRTGCETTLTTLEHCGVCDAACRLPNATASCATGQCRLTDCEQGFDDCDGDPENGCETRLDTIRNCGECGNRCDDPRNGAPACIDGECGIGRCQSGYGDCGAASDACEELVTLADCGECGQACEPDRATGSCETGECVVVECEAGFLDCNGLSDDGCEARQATLEHCGGCGIACDLPRAARPMCVADDDGVSCTVDHSCHEGDGAECEDGALENGCDAGFADCDGMPENGCETALNTLSDCQKCNQECREDNALTSCESGTCEIEDCELGYGPCGEDGACVPLASDESNCGECGNACPAEAPRCYGGRCTNEVCSPGTADCNAAFSCSTDLDDNDSCGVCGVDCTELPHANGACAARRCAITSCTDENHADCDGVVRNGCETDLTALTDCGACGARCDAERGVASCDDLTCRVTECDDGWADCNNDARDGCESATGLADSCGPTCIDCSAGDGVVSAGCDDGECKLTCKKGHADCNDDAVDGCEANLSDERTCGECGVDCAALRRVASASCGSEGCRDLVCESGYGDCDGIAENGCETSLRTRANCGGCDVPCAPARGTGSCVVGGNCIISSCDSGFADCNTDPEDGCESSLASAGSCGQCDTVCSQGLGCENGTCVCKSDADCPEGQDCCDGDCVDTAADCSFWPCPIPGTSRPLLHCGGCGTYCPASASFFCCAELF